jgi:hypothetical protein
MKVRFTSVGDEFSQPLFFTSQSLLPRVAFLIFSVCVLPSASWLKRPEDSKFWLLTIKRGCWCGSGYPANFFFYQFWSILGHILKFYEFFKEIKKIFIKFHEIYIFLKKR